MVRRKIDTNDNGVADTWVEDGTCGEGCTNVPFSPLTYIGCPYCPKPE